MATSTRCRGSVLLCVVLAVAVALVSIFCPGIGLQQTLITNRRPLPDGRMPFELGREDFEVQMRKQKVPVDKTTPLRPTFVLTLDYSGQQRVSNIMPLYTTVFSLFDIQTFLCRRAIPCEFSLTIIHRFGQTLADFWFPF